MTDKDRFIKDNDHQDERNHAWRKPEISRISLKRTFLGAPPYDDGLGGTIGGTIGDTIGGTV